MNVYGTSKKYKLKHLQAINIGQRQAENGQKQLNEMNFRGNKNRITLNSREVLVVQVINTIVQKQIYLYTLS